MANYWTIKNGLTQYFAEIERIVQKEMVQSGPSLLTIRQECTAHLHKFQTKLGKYMKPYLVRKVWDYTWAYYHNAESDVMRSGLKGMKKAEKERTVKRVLEDKHGKIKRFVTSIAMACDLDIRTEYLNKVLDWKEGDSPFYIVSFRSDCDTEHREVQGRVYIEARYNRKSDSRIWMYCLEHNTQSIQSVVYKDPYVVSRRFCKHMIRRVPVEEVLNLPVKDILIKHGMYQSK